MTQDVNRLAATAHLVSDDANIPRPYDPLGAGVDRFSLLVDSMHDHGIFMLDTRGCVASWNIGAARIKGYAGADIIGRHFSVFYTQEARDRRHPDEELRLALAHGSYTEEGWRVRKDGTQFWASVVITVLRDSQGEHVGFAKLTRDLTERRSADERLRQSEERLRLLVENVRDYAIFMLDPDGLITTWNSGAENITGYRADEVIGRHFSALYGSAEIAEGRPERELRVAIAEGRYEEEGWRVRKTGERFWANVVLTPVYDGANVLRGFAKVTRDLDAQRHLAQQAHEAERRAMMERARTLEAQGAVRQRDEFISVAAHELRTPLTALQLKIQGMRRALYKNCTAPALDPLPGFSERLDAALVQLKRFNGLVERLLDVSSIVAGKLSMKVEPIDLADLVRQVVDDCREAATQVGSDLFYHTENSLCGFWDAARLEQVLINLLSNAIKYGAGKPITVQIENTQPGARITVADQGIGVAAADIERIFGRFERAVSARHYGGLGLGLFVSRNIVEAHGGTLRVSSAAGGGSTFVVNLPLGSETPDLLETARG